MVRAGHAAQVGWDALGGEARAQLLERTADLYEEHARGVLLALHSRSREDPDRRGARSARGGRFPALLRVRSAAPVHQAAAASGPDRGAERAAPARPRRDREHFAVEFPARDLHRPDRRRRWPRAMPSIAKPAGQTPLIGALAVELMHQAGIPKDVVQLAPGSGRVVGGTLTAHPLLGGRRLHRLDRDRAHDQPHAGRARRADHPVRSPKPAARMR